MIKKTGLSTTAQPSSEQPQGTAATASPGVTNNPPVLQLSYINNELRGTQLLFRNVPLNFKEKIWSWQYVDLQTLIGNDRPREEPVQLMHQDTAAVFE